MLILSLLLLLQPARAEAALYVSAVAWGHDPAMFAALAEVESTTQINPPRSGDPQHRRWGRCATARTYPWRYKGLLQTREYPAKPEGSKQPFPPGELLMWPEASAWVGAIHLAGYERKCGKARKYEGYHSGKCLKPGSFTAKVRRIANQRRDEMKKAPTNTTIEARDKPETVLARAMVFGSSGAVEAQEAQGQRELVESEALPTDLNRNEETVRSWGVKFLGVDEHNPLFQHVELPAGWTKRATDHAMWTDLLDAKGRKRASIFYKAAFYDQRAFLNVERRFHVESDYPLREKNNEAVAKVLDCGKVVFETEPIPCGDRPGCEVQDRADALATVWLDEHYPMWKDAGAYWD